MNTQIILNIFLTLHIIAISMVVGVTIVNYIAFKQFWRLFDKNRQQGLTSLKGISTFQMVGLTGMALLLLSGIAMLWLFQWSFISLLWFKIKLLIVLLVFANGLTKGRKLHVKLQTFFADENNLNELKRNTDKLKQSAVSFQLSQLILFISIIILSVFKFG